MGNDGGSIPKRDDLVKTKHRKELIDPEQQQSTRWKYCSLSKRPLEEPVVSDSLGKLYNKSSALEYLIDKDHFGEDGKQIARHLKSMKDLIDLKLTRRHITSSSKNSWICPISLKEMGNCSGKATEMIRWIYLTGCGCVLTESGLTQIKNQSECPICGIQRKSDDVMTINPSEDEEQNMMIKLMERRKREKDEQQKKKIENKKRKKNMMDQQTEDRKSSNAQESEPKLVSDQPLKKLKSKLDDPNRVINSSSSEINSSSSMSKISNEIIKETQQNLTKLSSTTLNSIYGPRDSNGNQIVEDQSKQSWMTRGTWTRYAA